MSVRIERGNMYYFILPPDSHACFCITVSLLIFHSKVRGCDCNLNEKGGKKKNAFSIVPRARIRKDRCQGKYADCVYSVLDNVLVSGFSVCRESVERKDEEKRYSSIRKMQVKEGRK